MFRSKDRSRSLSPRLLVSPLDYWEAIVSRFDKSERFINPCGVISVSLNNDNMVDYTFTTSQGWTVTEYRPFSLSYAILNTPCLDSFRLGDNSSSKVGYRESRTGGIGSQDQDDLLGRLTSQKLTFQTYSVDVLKQMLAERVAIRDRNRDSLFERMNDLTAKLGILSQPYAIYDAKDKQHLEGTRLQLEKELRENDERLWKDTAELREKLILSSNRLHGTHFRSSLFGAPATHDDAYKGQGFAGLPD